MSENTKKAPSFREMLKRSALIQNPVLVQLVGLCPVVPAAVSLQSATLFAGMYLLMLLVTEVLASLLLRKLPRYIRVCIYLVVGLGMVLPMITYLEQYDQTILARIGIYFPLLAINSITALHCEKVAVKSSVAIAAKDALATGIGYAAVLLLVGALRELFGNGTLWGRAVLPQAMPRMSAMLLPFGGFLMLGLLAAVLRWILHKKYPEQTKQANLHVSRTQVKLREVPLPLAERLEKQQAQVAQAQTEEAQTPEVYDPQGALPPEVTAAEEAAKPVSGPAQTPPPEEKRTDPLQADMDAITQEFQALMRELEENYPGKDPDSQ